MCDQHGQCCHSHGASECYHLCLDQTHTEKSFQSHMGLYTKAHVILKHFYHFTTGMMGNNGYGTRSGCFTVVWKSGLYSVTNSQSGNTECCIQTERLVG